MKTKWTVKLNSLKPQSPLSGQDRAGKTQIRRLASTAAALWLGLALQPSANADSFTDTGSMGTARYSHSGTLLPNGKVLVAGGNNGGALSSAELYDPATATWTTTGAMLSARSSHSATLLPNGKVLVAGDYNGGCLSSAELYDPATGTWTATGAMLSVCQSHTATLLPKERYSSRVA